MCFYGLVHWQDPQDESLGRIPCHCSPPEGAVTKEGMLHYKAGTSYLGKEHWKTCFVVLRWEPPQLWPGGWDGGQRPPRQGLWSRYPLGSQIFSVEPAIWGPGKPRRPQVKTGAVPRAGGTHSLLCLCSSSSTLPAVGQAPGSLASGVQAPACGGPWDLFHLAPSSWDRPHPCHVVPLQQRDPLPVSRPH